MQQNISFITLVELLSAVVFVSVGIVGFLIARPSFAEIKPESIAGAWLFESAAMTLKDASDNGNDGAVKGNPQLVSGKFGYC